MIFSRKSEMKGRQLTVLDGLIIKIKSGDSITPQLQMKSIV